jgi:outer membrane protein assembly factor BamB
VYAGGVVTINTGFTRARLMAVKPDGTGDVTKTHVVYTLTKDVPLKTSPAVVDGRMYLVTDGGVLTCTEAATGKRLWRERIGGRFSASPLVAPGRIYLFDEKGTSTVIRPGPTYHRLAVSKLDAGCMGSPAVSGNALFVRTKTHVYRIQAKER